MAIPKATTLDYDPNVPVYVSPQTTETTTQLGDLPSNSTFVDENNTVQGRMTGLLGADSDYMKLNVAGAMKNANARGLLNSSMATQSGQAAAINSALPIAQQDASLFGDMSKVSQKTTQDSMLNNQLAGIEYKKSLNNAAITGALTQQETAGKFELQKLAETASMQRLEVDNQWKDLLNMSSLDSDEIKTLMQAGTALGTELQGGIERILRDPNITKKADAISALTSTYKSQLTTISAIASIPLVWS